MFGSKLQAAYLEIRCQSHRDARVDEVIAELHVCHASVLCDSRAR